jgi:phage gp46-like protein
MTYDGDPKIDLQGDQSTLTIVGGQPIMDEGLENAVTLSLFTATGWWGNSVSGGGSGRYGVSLDGIESRKLTNQTRLDAIEYARQALAWMIADGIAKSIEVDAVIQSVSMLALIIQIIQPDRSTTVRYNINWAAFAARVGAV